jgi:hypothetical protein
MNTRSEPSHFFPCSGKQEQDAGFKIEGVFELYKYCLQHVELSGPTYFAPMIRQVVEALRFSFQKDPDIYTLLLILTDGAIHDMSETIDWIVEGSNLPLSIIIIGIGGADFANMEQLDSDKQVRPAHRSCCEARGPPPAETSCSSSPSTSSSASPKSSLPRSWRSCRSRSPRSTG